MQTETLDKLYLEWSNFTRARNAREIEAAKVIDTLTRTLERMAEGGITPPDIDEQRRWARDTIRMLQAKAF